MRIASTGTSGRIGSAQLRRLGTETGNQLVGIARRVPKAAGTEAVR